jgi:hypothetical protein
MVYIDTMNFTEKNWSESVFFQFHGLQKTGPRWSGSVPAIFGSVLDWLWSTAAHFGGKKPD